MNLEGVEKTMLLTLYAKARHSKEKNHKFYDSKAVEIISNIDYDFTIAEKDKFMQLGTIARTIVLDEMVSEHIKAPPECTIVNIASDGEVYSAQRGMISNLRQKEAVIKAHESLKNAQETLDSGFPPDLAATDLENAISFLGEITGLTVSEEIINKIFSKFCLGK